MTKNSPEPDSGRLPKNISEESSSDRYEVYLNERDLEEFVEENEEFNVNVDNNGYELLPSTHNEEDIEFGYSTFDGEEFLTSTSHHYLNLLETVEAVRPANSEKKSSIPLDTTQIETIKSIMLNVSLPQTSIPSWAQSFTDEQLKKVVNEKVQNKQSN